MSRAPLAALIVTGAVIRLLMAGASGLGIDESYMVAAGRTLRLGYFDHPPFAWWLCAGIADLLGSAAPIVVRLPFIALFAVSSWLMYRLAASLFGARAGWWAALSFNLSPVFGVTTAGWVLPDGPLVCALLAAALCLVRALSGGWRWWLGAGAAMGLALLAKYSAVLTLAGAVLYLATQPQHRLWLRRPQPYVAALLAAALFAPVVVWNATHHWASFAFQGGRAGAEQVRPFGPLLVLGGEALFVLPWIWLPMMAVWLRARPADWRAWLPACLGAPPIVLFALIGLWSRHVLFHWAAPGYLMLFPLLGAGIAGMADRTLPRRVAAGTAALLLAVLLVVAIDLRHSLLRPDPGLQAMDWTALRPALAARGLFDPALVVAATGWQDAGKLDYGLGGGMTVICLGGDPRQYGLNTPADTVQGRDVLIVTRRPQDAEALAAQGIRFDATEALPPIVLTHPGGTGIRLFLLLGHRLALRGEA